jgi:hypothetical protein
MWNCVVMIRKRPDRDDLILLERCIEADTREDAVQAITTWLRVRPERVLLIEEMEPGILEQSS